MIYIVEDDANIRELVVYTLEKTGYEAIGFEESNTFYEALAKNKPELILLDIMLPGEDGITILKTLKNNPKVESVPVIMVTAKGTEFDKVIGLDMGADDYITKPFGMMELVARVKAVLRRNNKNKQSTIVSFKEIKMNLDEHTVQVDENNVVLTLKEFEILDILMKKPGNLISRENLLTQIWGYEYEGETRTLDVHIRTLRQKLGEAGNYIVTIRGLGYKLGEKNEK